MPRQQNLIYGYPKIYGRLDLRETPDDRRLTDVRTLAAPSFGLKAMYPFTFPLFCTKTINRPLPPPS